MMRKAVSAIAVCMAMGAGFPVLAGEAADEKTVKVSQVALDDPAGVALFYSRLKTAAHEVCNEGLTGISGLIITDRQCESDTLQRAVHDVHHPLLSRLHAAHDEGHFYLRRRHADLPEVRRAR